MVLRFTLYRSRLIILHYGHLECVFKMSSLPLMTMKNLTLSFGGKPLFQHLEFSIYEGDCICLVGKNGSGKSTLLKVLATLIEPDEADFFIQPTIKTAYLPQETEFNSDKTILETVLECGCEIYEAETYLDQLKLDPKRLCQGLSGGEKRRIALAKVLSTQADILFLDEPTNHLDMPTIEGLEEELSRKTFVVISHDRSFLNKVSNKTFWLERGSLYINKKGFQGFDTFTETIWAEEEKRLEKLNVKLKQELEWLHRGVTARRKRNQGRLRQLQKLREQKREQKLHQKLGSTQSSISSKLVFEAQNISKSYGKEPLIKNFSIRILKGDRIGIIGPNGAGKTTLLRLLMGQEQVDQGSIQKGVNIQVLYLDQLRESLKVCETVWENLCETGGDHVMINGKSRHVVAYLKDFLFSDKQAQVPVMVLSGGEKNRLALAKALTKPSNVLILDEPTNDLDMDTLDLLQDMLSDYTGTLLIVSHDRDFLDRLTTSIIAVEGQGYVEEYVGGYQDYLRERTYPAWFTKKIVKKNRVVNKLSEKALKLRYKDKRELELLPQEIEKVNRDINDIENKISDPTFYQNHPQEFLTLSHYLEELKEKSRKLEDRWLELEMLAETLSNVL